MTKRYLMSVAAMCVAALAWGVIPPGYYDDAKGLKKADLKAALHNIIGQADVLSYGSGASSTWSGFYQTDRMANGQVRDRYSYETHYFSSSDNASKASAVGGMNIEHSMANSWWGGTKNQAYKDIHHLMPCESTINSKKSNYPMGLVTNDKQGNGCTKVGTGPGASGNISLWEPADEWKGDFARVYFYMATCYSNLTWQSAATQQMQNNDWPTLMPWATEILLQWNQDDPVDDIEIERNEKVYGIQGNRNPFIDYPDLAEYIWGSKMTVAWQPDGSQGGGGDIEEPAQGEEVELLAEDFAASLGEWTPVLSNGAETGVWGINSSYKCAIGNAYNYGKQADAWLVSPVIDLSKLESAAMTFSHATGFNGGNDARTRFTLLVTPDIDDALVPNDAHWTELEIPTWPSQGTGNYTSFVESGDIALTDFCGGKVRIAFRYVATTSQCWAWELRELAINGVTSTADRIDDNFAAPVSAPTAVFTLGGTYIGTEVPARPGIYVVRSGRHAYKVTR